jgi:hypothetical protein
MSTNLQTVGFPCRTYTTFLPVNIRARKSCMGDVAGIEEMTDTCSFKGRLRLRGRIILKRVVKTHNARLGLDSSGSVYCPVAGSY